jgi:hypothetical protein
MNEQPIRETARAETRRRVHVFTAMICRVSDASFFHARRPLIESALESTMAPEK